MPPISYKKGELDKLYNRVVPSVVSVNTYDNINYGVDFATGFIIFSNRSLSLVCVHRSFIKKKKRLYVHFSDGTVEEGIVVLERSKEHTILITESKQGHARTTVSFSLHAVERVEVFLITEVEGGYHGFNFMTGSIISPSCKTVDKSMKMIPGSASTFAFSCPANKQVLGAGVFDLNGLLIGTVSSFDDQSGSLKFAQETRNWVNELELQLKAINVKISLSKKSGKGQPRPRVTKKRKLKD